MSIPQGYYIFPLGNGNEMYWPVSKRGSTLIAAIVMTNIGVPVSSQHFLSCNISTQKAEAIGAGFRWVLKLHERLMADQHTNMRVTHLSDNRDPVLWKFHDMLHKQRHSSHGLFPNSHQRYTNLQISNVWRYVKISNPDLSICICGFQLIQKPYATHCKHQIE